MNDYLGVSARAPGDGLTPMRAEKRYSDCSAEGGRRDGRSFLLLQECFFDERSDHNFFYQGGVLIAILLY